MPTVNFRPLVIDTTGLTQRSSNTDLRQFTRLAGADGPYEGFASGAYEETLPAGDPFPTSVTWWTSAAKTTKIMQMAITWNGNSTVATTVTTMYDTDGVTVLSTVTDTYAYSGVFLTSRTRTVV